MGVRKKRVKRLFLATIGGGVGSSSGPCVGRQSVEQQIHGRSMSSRNTSRGLLVKSTVRAWGAAHCGKHRRPGSCRVSSRLANTLAVAEKVSGGRLERGRGVISSPSGRLPRRV